MWRSQKPRGDLNIKWNLKTDHQLKNNSVQKITTLLRNLRVTELQKREHWFTELKDLESEILLLKKHEIVSSQRAFNC